MTPTPQRSRDSIVGAIVRGLYEGRYAPGQRLIEADLTAEYGVSRGPVREALSRLAAEGIVTLAMGRSAAIRRLGAREAVDLLNLLEVLVGLAARQAAARVDAAARQRLAQALAALEAFDERDGSADYARARDSFYGTLIAIGGNAELARVMPAVQVHLLRVQFRRELGAVDARRHKDYRAIAAAVLAGDGEAAERLGRAHIARLGRHMAASEAAAAAPVSSSAGIPS